MIKWLVMRYIKRACENRSNASYYEFYGIIDAIFTYTNEIESESNDSTVYAQLMSDIKGIALNALKSLPNVRQS